MILRLVSSPAVLARPLVACYAIMGLLQVGTITLSTLLPFHVITVGGTRTQVGLLFSVSTIVSMGLRPAVGGWIDRIGARPVMLPGILGFAAASLALHVAATPHAVIAVMAGAGLGNALVGTPAGILAARGAGRRHRGEVLGLYYLSSSLSMAVAPPLAFGLRALGGMPLAFVTVTALAGAVLVLVLSLPPKLAAPVAGVSSGFRPVSRAAVSASSALVLTTIGQSSIYAFVPLYAASRGRGHLVVWFFAVYSAWMIVGRALGGRLSDRVGRVHVALPAMLLLALAYFTLAIPPGPLTLIAAALFLGSGNAVLYPTLAALVLDRAPDTERGLALGTLSAAWDLGIVVGSAAVGLVAEHVSFAGGFAVGGVAAIAGALVFLLTERRHVRPVVEPAGVPAG